MYVEEILTTAFDTLGELHDPIMVLSLRGWFDATGVASDALDVIALGHPAPVVASIDPDPFFDFTQERPTVEIDDDDQRTVVWPANEFRLLRRAGSGHDLVVLRGVEPHLRFGLFADAVVEVANQLDCDAVITVGAAADGTPHTRRPAVVGSTTNHHLAKVLGLSRPRYQGITGLVGVLQERLESAGIPSISLRVGVPHYLSNAKHPASTAALVEQLARILGLSPDITELHSEVDLWRAMHDEAVDDDPPAQAYVSHLEQAHDRDVEANIDSAEDLGAAFETFLRDLHRGPDEPF